MSADLSSHALEFEDPARASEVDTQDEAVREYLYLAIFFFYLHLGTIEKVMKCCRAQPHGTLEFRDLSYTISSLTLCWFFHAQC